MNPFTRDFPVAVLLRNKHIATVERLLAKTDSGGFPLQGSLATMPGVPEAWRLDGRYAENGRNHPLDIVAEITAYDEAEGTYRAIPFAPAAGAKGATP